MAVQVNLSYEVIFDILMREKGREELQRLEPSFFSDAAQYISSKAELSPADDDARERVNKQIQNVKRLLRELYERREKKIMNLALVASRTSPSFVDLANMLAEEKRLFDGILDHLNSFRKEILTSAINPKDFISRSSASRFAESKAESEQASQKDLQDSDFVAASDFSPKNIAIIKNIRFTEFVPRFVGKELEIYGPFMPNQVAIIPAEFANVLISKGSAVEITD